MLFRAYKKIFSGDSSPKTPAEGLRAPPRPASSADARFSADYVYSCFWRMITLLHAWRQNILTKMRMLLFLLK